jgi:curved DNA-binding protein CbpA
MARINSAYDLLRDPVRRARYDASPAARRRQDAEEIVGRIDARHPRGEALMLPAVPRRAVGVVLECQVSPATLDLRARRRVGDAQDTVRIAAEGGIGHTERGYHGQQPPLPALG